MAGAHLSIRIDLQTGDRIGPGKIELLEAIRSTGSISAAARSTGMSYRRAWLLVEEINRALRMTIVMVTHDRPRAERFSQRIITMADGKLIGDGAGS